MLGCRSGLTLSAPWPVRHTAARGRKLSACILSLGDIQQRCSGLSSVLTGFWNRPASGFAQSGLARRLCVAREKRRRGAKKASPAQVVQHGGNYNKLL